ncbi:MAG: glycoside hydrolase family 16 protein [Maricaulaceae bacterium]
MNVDVKSKGWVRVWGDEFDAPELDRSKWEPEVSCWGGGNNEKQCYTDRSENIIIEEGVLKLRAQKESISGPKYPQGRADRGPMLTREYSSGKVRTRERASWKYGRIEARIKLPKGQSTWSAFWMLPAGDLYGGWPLSGEIDIMEAVNLGAKCGDCGSAEVEYRTSAALHFGKASPDNVFITDKRALANLAAVDDYHEYAVEWGEGSIHWFVDGEKFLSATADDWYSDAIDKAENESGPFDQAFYLMFNLAVGGDLPDLNNEKRFNPKSFPSELWLDWVRVYQCETDPELGLACMK